MDLRLDGLSFFLGLFDKSFFFDLFDQSYFFGLFGQSFFFNALCFLFLDHNSFYFYMLI